MGGLSMILPHVLAKSNSEHAHQTALFAWSNLAEFFGFAVAFSDDPFSQKSQARPIPELKWFHAVPNGGSRGDTVKSRLIRGSQLKAEGVKSGVSDTMLPVKRNGFSGLYIELKKPGKIKDTSLEQDEFGAFVQSQGFKFEVHDSWLSAAKSIEAYLKS